MPELLRMPAVAADTEEATLASWPIAEHQSFGANDVIATVETAKAAVDVEAERAGVLVKTLVTPGTDVAVGEAIALLAAPGETVDDVDAVLARLGVTATRPVPAPAPPAAPESPASPAADHRDRIFASPLARRIAREAGVAEESLTGSGPHGRIVRRDVERAIAAREPARAPTPATRAADGYAEVPHSKLRRAIAQRLTESKQTIPHFYLRGTARVDALLALRAELNATSRVKISVNDLVVKAVAAAHTEVDGVNVNWTESGMRRFDAVDLGIAVATGTGLVTPVLRGVDRMSIRAVSAAAQDLVERAKSGGLKQAELEGGSATITNLGMYGTEEFAAIINPPQSAILAVGAARPEPVATAKGRLKVATVLHVTLSVDHRAIDGALAAQWMRTFLAMLEQPVQILA